MTLKGTFNAPQYTPGRSWDERSKPCCARCQRGTKAVLGPCGDTNCKCHERATKMIDYVAIHRDTALTTLFPADASHSEEYRITHAAGIAAVVAAAKREAATVASETFDGLGIAPEASIRDWIRRAIVAEATQ